MTSEASALERARLTYEPRLPAVLRAGLGQVAFVEESPTSAARDADAVRERFPASYGRPALRLAAGAGPGSPRALRVGVVLSGGQAPGGHNVVAGLLDALRGVHPDSRLLGFLGGPAGILASRLRELTPAVVAPYRNTGGFDLIGSGRDKIETAEQFATCAAACTALGLDGLVIVGGDDSNTNAAALAEHFLAHGLPTRIVGVPKTIDGDLKGGGVETSFGFDTATKVYSELVGNICRDARSAGKYWHFIKLMGRSASHVALECALQVRPNVTLIGEEVEERGLGLGELVDEVAEVVRRRAEAGRDYGVCLVPEGLIEFLPEIRALIAELNVALQQGAAESPEGVRPRLGRKAQATFDSLPARIREQLLLERDSHGNVQVSKIDTEALVVEKVTARIAAWRAAGRFGGKLQVQSHFFGYEGRCAAPSNFDADYTCALGHVAAALVAFGRSGYLAAVRNLSAPTDDWRPAAVPLTSLMQIETRKGRAVAVIGKALVRTAGAPFRAFAAERERWALEDAYVYPGAIQYFGPLAVAGAPTRTLLLESGGAAAD